MMVIQCLFILFFKVLHFISINAKTCNKSILCDELVVDLGDSMGNSDRIELVGVEDSIHSNKVAMVYL
jgi:hypothetical protein